MVVFVISCEQALAVYEKLKNEILRDKEVYPAGKLLLCMENLVSETRDVDANVVGISKMKEITVDGVIVHLFPYRKAFDECYKLPCRSGIYYCILYKILAERMRSSRQPHRGWMR